MAYVVMGREARAPERVTYEEERVIRRVSGPRGRVQAPQSWRSDDRYLGRSADEPLHVRTSEEPKKEPGYIQTVAKNGGKLVATGVGVAGFGTFWYGAFQAIGGSHHVPGVGHFPTAGVAPGALMFGGFLAMLGAGALWHWLNPKK